MLKTVVYADIFDYPLSGKELNRFLISGDSLPKIKKNYYCLPGRGRLIALRRKRGVFSRQKWPLAVKAAKTLALVPWIRMVAVTGALAMGNADKDDDIDLMVITSKNRLWLSRLLSLGLIFPRLRRAKKVNNRVCLNLWLDETALTLEHQDLYTAHELCQARPVLNRGQTYQKFIGANLWYKKFLPFWTI